MAKKRNFTHDEVEHMLKLYQDGWAMQKIAGKFNCSPATISYQLNKVQGFSARSQKETSRKYEADWDFFETIDTEFKAYWLGFLYADGYISKKPSNLVGVSLAEKDFPHLCYLKGDLQATHPIIQYEPTSGYGKDPYVRFVIISDKIVADLEKHGVVEQKTNTLLPPTTVPDHLIRHFIRGFVDGDGGWSKTSRGIGYKLAVTGTKEMLVWTARQLDIVPRMHKRHPDRDTNNFTLEAQSKGDLAKIIPYLYKDIQRFMIRKYDLAMEIRPLLQ